MSIVLWCANDRSTGTPQTLVDKDNDSGTRGWDLGVDTNLKPEFWFYDGSSWDTLVADTILSSDGSWNHLALVFTPSTSYVFYRDGVADGTLSSGVNASIQDSGTNLGLGARITGTARPFAGDVDEIGIFDRALNLIAINDIKDYGLDGTGKTNAVEWCDISYSTATGGFAWNADANSNDNGNNSGWNFASGAVRRIILTQWKNTLNK